MRLSRLAKYLWPRKDWSAEDLLSHIVNVWERYNSERGPIAPHEVFGLHFNQPKELTVGNILTAEDVHSIKDTCSPIPDFIVTSVETTKKW